MICECSAVVLLVRSVVPPCDVAVGGPGVCGQTLLVGQLAAAGLRRLHADILCDSARLRTAAGVLLCRLLNLHPSNLKAAQSAGVAGVLVNGVWVVSVGKALRRRYGEDQAQLLTQLQEVTASCVAAGRPLPPQSGCWCFSDGAAGALGHHGGASGHDDAAGIGPRSASGVPLQGMDSAACALGFVDASVARAVGMVEVLAPWRPGPGPGPGPWWPSTAAAPGSAEDGEAGVDPAAAADRHRAVGPWVDRAHAQREHPGEGSGLVHSGHARDVFETSASENPWRQSSPTVGTGSGAGAATATATQATTFPFPADLVPPRVGPVPQTALCHELHPRQGGGGSGLPRPGSGRAHSSRHSSRPGSACLGALPVLGADVKATGVAAGVEATARRRPSHVAVPANSAALSARLLCARDMLALQHRVHALEVELRRRSAVQAQAQAQAQTPTQGGPGDPVALMEELTEARAALGHLCEDYAAGAVSTAGSAPASAADHASGNKAGRRRRSRSHHRARDGLARHGNDGETSAAILGPPVDNGTLGFAVEEERGRVEAAKAAWDARRQAALQRFDVEYQERLQGLQEKVRVRHARSPGGGGRPGHAGCPSSRGQWVRRDGCSDRCGASGVCVCGREKGIGGTGLL
jgi:hypothetical protein